jgi:hypothetical protein
MMVKHAARRGGVPMSKPDRDLERLLKRTDALKLGEPSPTDGPITRALLRQLGEDASILFPDSYAPGQTTVADVVKVRLRELVAVKKADC